MSKVTELFPSFEKSLVDEIENDAVIKEFKAGDVIMRTGQYIKNAVLVIKGAVKVYREGDEGSEFFMYHLFPGQACAITMICATRSETSQVTAKAVEDTTLLMIPLAMMEKWMGSHKTWYEFVIETYRSRFEELLIVIDHIAFRSMDERLQYYLEKNAETLGSKDIATSHQEIANDLNSSREVISRLLKKMEQRGLVNLHRNHIQLLK